MSSEKLNILLADDDIDDCDFFREALDELQQPPRLTAVHNGEQLMRYLANETNEIPAIIFLDLNMPRKSGFECLLEIKLVERLMLIPIIMFSTSFELSVVDLVYKNGAHYFIRKPSEFAQFKMVIRQSLMLVAEGNTTQPSREDFVITAYNSLII